MLRMAVHKTTTALHGAPKRWLAGAAVVLAMASGTMAQDTPPAETPPAEATRTVSDPPLQVKVTVKIIEFQATKGVETGLSAYFARLPRVDAHGSVVPNSNAIDSADLTFPTSVNAGITVFLDRLRLSEGDIEVVLQALVDENRAFILSEPTAYAMVGGAGTTVQTVQEVPYENTQVVGNVAVQITDFRDTGVTLTVAVPEIIDDDGDWDTTRDDTYIHLDVLATVQEEGQRIVVSLDDQLAAGSNFNIAQNAIAVPEFVSRMIDTEVWVRHGQVLIMGGLYRNTDSRSLSTVPWLTQAEDFAIATAEQIIPGNFLASPLSSGIGNRQTEESRRELVFLIKAETWRPSRSLMLDLGLDDEEDAAEKKRPTDVITDVIEGISVIPQGIREGITGDENDQEGVDANLGGIKD